MNMNKCLLNLLKKLLRYQDQNAEDMFTILG